MHRDAVTGVPKPKIDTYDPRLHVGSTISQPTMYYVSLGLIGVLCLCISEGQNCCEEEEGLLKIGTMKRI